MPAASRTSSLIEFVPDNSIAPSQLIDKPLTFPVIFVHVLPLLTEPYRTSPDSSPVLKVAVIVCAAIAVLKSVLLVPVSALSAKPLMVVVGARVSIP